MQRVVSRVAFVAAFALLAGACGGGGGVGEGLKEGKGGNGEGAIGQATTTTTEQLVIAAPTTRVTAPVVTQPVPPAAIYTINNDTKGQYVDPLTHSVRAGLIVRFTNADNIAHVVDGKINGQLVLGPSPQIAPGASWDVKPTIIGTYDIIDEQRPYASGVTLQVHR